MGIDFYTGLDTVPATSQLTANFNKTAINADGVKNRNSFYGAEVTTVYSTNLRTFTNNVDFILPMESLVYDTGGFWSATSPSQVSFPPGFTYVEVMVQCVYSTGNWQLGIYKNGSPLETHPGGSVDIRASIGTTTQKYRYQRFRSPIILATAGDYFQASLTVPGVGTSTFDVDLDADYVGTVPDTTIHHQVASIQIRAYK